MLSGSMGFLAVAWPATAVLAVLLKESDPEIAHSHFVDASAITDTLRAGLRGQLATRWDARVDIVGFHREALSADSGLSGYPPIGGDGPVGVGAVTLVLIVDDAPAVRDGLRRLVSGLPGVASVSLASGEEALVRCLSDRPDLVLLDVRMPGMTGLECARRLLHSHPSVRIVMLTAGEDPQAVATAVANGAAGYISKDATRLEMGLAIHHVGGVTGRHPTRRPRTSCPSARPRCSPGCRADCQWRDRPRTVPVRGHHQDPRPPIVPQTAGCRPRPGRRGWAGCGKDQEASARA